MTNQTNNPSGSGAGPLAECFSCGGKVARADHVEHQTYSPSESQACGMGFSAGANTVTVYAIRCECGVCLKGNNPELLEARWNRRDPIAALIARNAELEGLSADRKEVIECKNIDIRERDEAITGWAARARKAEAARDALAVENKALRDSLQSVVALDPAETDEGFNEWGEAQCFNDVKTIASKALLIAVWLGDAAGLNHTATERKESGI